MIVENKKSSSTGEDGGEDKFPIGMRVLAVDDDPICLKVIETLLQKCQYQVTTTNQAVTALKMLRENRNKYDLVISDVNMPDMDGFKLLELVGLEMDLPVIMLSAHSDTKLVMKGISHGAVDYLLKPVRIEELKNIWQHVVRKKKIDPKNQSKSANQENAHAGMGENGQAAASTGNSDPNGKANRKRKDQDDDDDEEADEEGNENEDSSTQKKPRVVWSVELHRKFVAAVNQLGLDKAVPKKILDLMNVEGLTRENVASHLQKYRLYLKRISNVASQQANIAAAFGSKDSTYLRMGALDGYTDFRLGGSGRISSAAISSYPPGSMLNRLNSTAGLTIRGISSSGIIQPGHSQTLNNSFNSIGKIQQSVLPANQSANMFQGVQTSIELSQLPQSKSTTLIGESNHINYPSAFPAPTGFADARVTLGCSSSCATTASGNSFMLQAGSQPAQIRGAFGSQPSFRCDESWPGGAQLSTFPSNSLPMSEPFGHDQIHSNNLNGNLPSTISQITNNPLDLSSSITTSVHMDDTRGGVQCQTGLIDNVVQNINYNHNLNNSFSSGNSLASVHCGMGPFSQSLDQSSPYIVQQNGVGKSSLETKLRSNEDYLFEQSKSQDGFIQNNYDSLDDIMSAIMKRDQNETLIMDGELGFDAYSLGSCM
ncbi:hypothetical protein Pint_14534 [Pistacia integerrima]|uniref:Uncharacterized protein n=1 Tax=Pistacia integerrima TaxID=434235 RepID=A0ACC0Y6G7_9ROSI|nr:hypothetical protein Pint_14534 [Pistacia integerrima]